MNAHPAGGIMNNQTGAQFEILVDGKPRSYRDTKSGAMDAATFLKSGIQSALRSPAFQLMVPKAERRASSAGTFFSSATFIASRTMPLKSSS
jgi:hypothetical protein